ncbi:MULTISPECIES: xanthine dehydrogenase family protein molybdopterin-binding subunit [unclassified Streptomyces]|uniref:xanthine dehydrogenase family protein molybdopterin-binding subunit n=1 Tax=unclassified Streptomyces TaxID=2593676 RepID=UPI002DDA85BB|nr:MULTISPECIES: xanthine dehydrogenase family protein molybdopterin-binding subunit [unclassified Streptomyces]WSC40761.1 xanthine dehydrogenase family protein molybdopterin-binding subunit [Streptomyces sp. NBC_01763]WSC52133.1 xanthine dehydrogenase family protein molybdopterin-binding subunit [Streptomyces sp. NBC_01761]WSF82980.1 xanthine dehydrogenase family protein molybdopterin-binding subunit [Streptomyces sp. NBC_01744]
MTTISRPRLLGPGVNRVDGPLKVTGKAPYPSDFAYRGMAHAVLVRSTVGSGRITEIDTTRAERAAGVVRVLTHLNAGHLERGPMTPLGVSPPAPLQDDVILHYGQHVAVVVADTFEEATEAANLVRVGYSAQPALLELDDPRAELRTNPWGRDAEWGDVAGALASAEAVLDETYLTVDNTNNPMGPLTTVARWEGDTLLVNNSTQWASLESTSLAAIFGIPEESVHVMAPYVGGGFGAGLRVWPHVVLAALAARVTGRPVKLVLTRPQMFTACGHRPKGRQRVRLGATREGHLVAIDHEALTATAIDDDNFEPTATVSATSYACPNVSTHDMQVRLNIPVPNSMRGPGAATGNYALECAMDELAYKLGMDPLDLRLCNDAALHPPSGLPWSSRAHKECLERGAELFGWSRRTHEPRSMREDGMLVGYGLAAVGYPWFRARCLARATIRRDGTAYVCSAGSEIGNGAYTVFVQLSAELLGLDPGEVTVGLGESTMPLAPQTGGSGLTSAVGSAIYEACRKIVGEVLDIVADDIDSPLRGCTVDDVEVGDGGIRRRDDPARFESYRDILTRHRLPDLTAEGESAPSTPQELGMAPAGAFGAKYVEVRVDPDLGRIRVARAVSVIDGGRILNAKTARSQIIGGAVGGIGMALFEETVSDAGTGRIANATLGDYIVPVDADIPDMQVEFVGSWDRANPIGTKGIGEIGLVGLAPAIANGIFHATGRRIRSLPITMDQLL